MFLGVYNVTIEKLIKKNPKVTGEDAKINFGSHTNMTSESIIKTPPSLQPYSQNTYRREKQGGERKSE